MGLTLGEKTLATWRSGIYHVGDHDGICIESAWLWGGVPSWCIESCILYVTLSCFKYTAILPLLWPCMITQYTWTIPRCTTIPWHDQGSLPEWPRLLASRRFPSLNFSVGTMPCGELFVQIWWMQPEWTYPTLRTRQEGRTRWTFLVPVAWGSIPSFVMLDVTYSHYPQGWKKGTKILVIYSWILCFFCRVRFGQQTSI